MYKNHEFDIAVLILFFMVIIFISVISMKSCIVKNCFEKRVLSAYSLFTNRQLNKDLIYDDSKKKWVLIADERVFDGNKTNMSFETVKFTEKERGFLLNQTSNTDFMAFTIGCALNGYFSNEWRMSKKIVIQRTNK